MNVLEQLSGYQIIIVNGYPDSKRQDRSNPSYNTLLPGLHFAAIDTKGRGWGGLGVMTANASLYHPINVHTFSPACSNASLKNVPTWNIKSDRNIINV